MSAPFATPTVHVNQVGWGPTDLPEQYLLLPFQPFGKGDRLGRCADFSQKDSRYKSRYQREREENTENQAEQFQTIEDKSKQKSKSGFKRTFRGRFSRGGGRTNRAFIQKREQDEEQKKLLKGKHAKYLVQHMRGRGGKQFQRRNNTWGRFQNRNILSLEASVKIESSWKMLDQFDLSALTKLRMTPPKAEDLKTCGYVCRYNESYERVSTKAKVKLERYSTIQFNSTTTMDDPVIQQYATEYAAQNSGRVVFATDELIAHLMACPRSVLPWDVYFTRLDNGLMFIDKREDSGLEMLTVNETVQARNIADLDKNSIADHDQPDKLSIEATAINQNFSQQVVDKTKKKRFGNPNPFWDEEDEEEGTEPAAFGYKYRKWQLADDLTLLARTEVHGYMKKQGSKRSSYLTVYALNESNPRLSGSAPWKQRIDQSRGSVIATELKNNACKVGKWTAQTLLSGADLMKVGFITRDQVRDPFHHSIVGTQFYRPEDFAAQINLHQNNMWGIIKSIIDMIYKQEPGKYVLLKDPNKPHLQVYAVPMNTFVDDDDDEDEDDEGEDDEEEE